MRRVGSPTTSRNELLHWFLKQKVTGHNSIIIMPLALNNNRGSGDSGQIKIEVPER